MNDLEYICASKPRYMKGTPDDIMSDGSIYHIDSSVKHARRYDTRKHEEALN